MCDDSPIETHTCLAISRLVKFLVNFSINTGSYTAGIVCSIKPFKQQHHNIAKQPALKNCHHHSSLLLSVVLTPVLALLPPEAQILLIIQFQIGSGDTHGIACARFIQVSSASANQVDRAVSVVCRCY